MRADSLLPLAALVIASSSAAQPPPPATTPGAEWRQSQRRDNADSYTYTRYTLVGRFLTSPQIADHPALRVDCIPASGSSHAKFLAAGLLVGTPLKIDYVEPEEIRGIQFYPKVTVRYRLDSREEERGQWAAGTDRVPTAKPSDKDSATLPKELLKRILRAHTFSVIAADEHGGTLEMRFDLPDALPVRAACNVDE